MKNSLLLVLFLVSIQLSFGQLKKKYSIFLNFDASKNEMIVSEKKMSDSIWVRTYKFSKDTSKESCKFALQINQEGELIKRGEANKLIKAEETVTLYHYSYRNRVEELDKMPNKNVINYNDFINSEFKSFNKVLKNAEHIYVIDKSFTSKNTGKIKAYQIVF
ncbi:hypothetical protein [Winogradskyella alexanderae]|uniref:Uncharacterized protein n=1 Tax=Winogradskyella alexanderae TaxID=2877123 RepID=A0ABS7XNF9_9FLAO|nr:hypothetical protein [Winogradskyella alexanderae]MCA0131539.1 hypothetical protein [Winogradskyella alexanderae]